MNDLKTKALDAIIPVCVIALLTFVGWDIAVEKYLIPHIKKKLIEENYLNEDIKQGKFIVVDETSFNTNHKLAPELIKNLKKNTFSTKSDIAKLDDDTQQKITDLTTKVKQLTEQISLLEAKQEGAIKLTLYISENKNEKGIITLNKSNLSIAKFIKNNQSYTLVSQSGNTEEFKTRIQNLKLDGKDVTTAVARLYVDDYHQLFEAETNQTIGQAFLKFTE